MSASGSSVTRAPAKRSGVHDQRSTGMLTTVMTAANRAVQRHAPATSIRLATDQIADGSSLLTNG